MKRDYLELSEQLALLTMFSCHLELARAWWCLVLTACRGVRAGPETETSLGKELGWACRGSVVPEKIPSVM